MSCSSYTLDELLMHTGGTLHGDGACVITGVAPLVSAIPGTISFLDNPRYRRHLQATQASAVIVTKEDVAGCTANAIEVSSPCFAFVKVCELFSHRVKPVLGIHPTAVIDDSCCIGKDVTIGPYCVLEQNVNIGDDVVIGANCVIGANTTIGTKTRLWPQVTLYDDVTLGSGVVIHSGAVIGADGFGLTKEQGEWVTIPQLGGVTIGNGVEIGASTTIDRGALSDTMIGDGVRIDNLVQIGHNVKVGKHTAIAGCAGVAGSTEIGEHCIIGGAACIAGHIKIVDNVTVTGMAGISRSLHKPGVYASGIRAKPYKTWLKAEMAYHRLGGFIEQLKQLSQEFAEYKKSNE